MGARFGRDRSGARTATLRLPFVTASFEVAPPHGVGRVRLGSMSVPMPGRSAYYLGLGALTVVELIEWPVAIAIAAGTYVAEQASAAQGRGPAAGSRGARGGPAGRSGEVGPRAGVRAEGAESTVGLALPLPRSLLRRFRHEEHGTIQHGNGHDHGGQAEGDHAHNGHRSRVAG